MFYIYLFFFLIFLFSFLVVLFIKDELKIKLFFLVFSLFFFIGCGYFFIHSDFFNLNLISDSFVLSKKLNLILVLSVDTISIVFVLLTSFIFFVVALISWNSIKYKVALFFFLVLFLEFSVVNVFINFDLLFFYVWYESSLIPIFFIVLIWGSPYRKIIAAFHLMFFTLLCSTAFFISIIFIHYKVGITNMLLLSYYVVFTKNFQILLFIPFFLAFAVKIPLFPIHIWLPEAHVESPTVGSVILASLLLKLGYYGCLRICLPYFYDAIIFYRPFLSLICLLGCVYGSLLSLSQNDIKKIIAYSSVSHMSLCILGLFSSNLFGILGSFLMAIGHSFVSSGLFYLVGVFYDRYHTRSLDYFSGFSVCLPNLSFVFFVFIISNFGFPISLNFIAEFFIFIGIGSLNIYILLFLIFYSVLSVAYNLLVYLKIFHGTLNLKILKLIPIDLQKKEFFIVLPLLFLNSFLCFFASTLIRAVIPTFLLILF